MPTDPALRNRRSAPGETVRPSRGIGRSAGEIRAHSRPASFHHGHSLPPPIRAITAWSNSYDDSRCWPNDYRIRGHSCGRIRFIPLPQRLQRGNTRRGGHKEKCVITGCYCSGEDFKRCLCRINGKRARSLPCRNQSLPLRRQLDSPSITSSAVKISPRSARLERFRL